MDENENTLPVSVLRQNLYGFDSREVDNRRNDRENSPNIKNLWQRNHEIVNLAARGFKQTEIAEILHIHPQTVSNTLNSELGMRKLAEIRKCRDDETKKISEKIRVLTDKALSTYHEIFDDKSGELGLKDKGNFASDFLNNISGLRAPTRIQSQSISTVMTADELASFRNRGLREAKATGITIDVENSNEPS
jgi:predicted transcriptional regulator